MIKIKTILPILMLAFVITSCEEELSVKYYEGFDLMENTLNIPDQAPDDYTLEFPAYYGRTGFFDKSLATLGRVIFYDTKLSADQTISCASCHKQELAFSDDAKLSDGIFDNVTFRNSLPLGAVFNFQEYYGPNRVPFFWDNSVQTVEEQIVKTFGSKEEMDMTIPQVVDVMNSNDYYLPLLRRLGLEKANDQIAVSALAEFVNSIGSYGSHFDKCLSEENPTFNVFFTNNSGTSCLLYTSPSPRDRG